MCDRLNYLNDRLPPESHYFAAGSADSASFAQGECSLSVKA